MRSKFYTEDQLMSLPITVLRGVDIMDKEEEALVQKVVNLRLMNMPVEGDVFRGDVPDIRTKEEEEKWQKIIDERVEAKKKRIMATHVEPEPEIVPPDETIEPLIVPELDKILESPIGSTTTALNRAISKAVNDVVTDLVGIPKVEKPPFCNRCTSKGRFHKKDCPKRDTPPVVYS